MYNSDYDHSKKAGNEGDVIKHVFLLNRIDDLIRESKDVAEPFWYIDSHSARPYHRLHPQGKWTHGIGKLHKTADTAPELLAEYLSFCFYEEDLPRLSKTAFTGMGARLYLGSSALVSRRFSKLASKQDFQMTLFDIDANVCDSLFEYYKSKFIHPLVLRPDGYQPEIAKQLSSIWKALDSNRQLIIAASCYDYFEKLMDQQGDTVPSFVFIDPHRLGKEREEIQSILASCKNMRSPFLCWTPLTSVMIKGLSNASWSWEQNEKEDEIKFNTFCKNNDFRIAWFGWGSVSGASQNTYGCQLVFDSEYSISELKEKCNLIQSACNGAGIHVKNGEFRVRCWPDQKDKE
ncbi:23S rRNA (adenine(2030)-N(6))-methyltransferase RlmJ [Gimesia algae]|uniref:Ribosomal RNA large subunit methyltransferase J n=1 Tax=Gimesia algae TaxID=2527971 RepID=A0A517VFE3_9PLAN|nr:hypothetical protein [Gimesia algae]QDT91733.1 Ribosomal RNA large subunit methyltransferase J [Gimesia algae]